MAKSYGSPTNEALRAVARELKATRFGGLQRAFAEGLGVSTAYLSDFLKGNRGAGLELLVGLSKYAPLDVLRVLEIDIPTVLRLAAHEGARGANVGEEESMQNLPAPVARAARAAVELLGCTTEEAINAAHSALDECGDVPGSDPEWWLAKLRDRLPKRAASGTRPSVRLRAAEKTRS